MNDVLFSSKSEEWATPQDVFDKLDAEFHFTLDPCATAENAKCKKYYTKDDDGLLQDWNGETVFCNPPYGREIGKWIAKADKETRGGGDCCSTLTGAHRYTIFSRLHISKTRDAIFARARSFQQRRQRTVSVDGSHYEEGGLQNEANDVCV